MLLTPTSSGTLAGGDRRNGWRSIPISAALALPCSREGVHSRTRRTQTHNIRARRPAAALSLAENMWSRGLPCAGSATRRATVAGIPKGLDGLRATGAPVPWLPAKAESDWPINAPRIGGTPLPASDADVIKLLTTGVWTTGSPLRPPMAQFRMNREDADSVIAYLKSLSPQP